MTQLSTDKGFLRAFCLCILILILTASIFLVSARSTARLNNNLQVSQNSLVLSHTTDTSLLINSSRLNSLYTPKKVSNSFLINSQFNSPFDDLALSGLKPPKSWNTKLSLFMSAFVDAEIKPPNTAFLNSEDKTNYLSSFIQYNTDWPQISLASPISGFNKPIHITHAGDGSGRLFVVEQTGRIRIVRNGQLLPAPFLDISNRVNSTTNSGMMSVAFPPEYAARGHFYVYYINNNNQPEIARYRITNNPDIADSNSGQIVLTVTSQTTAGHVGGQISFNSRDGYLYLALGDGDTGGRGEPGDPENRAQNPNELRGKMLRIDVETGSPTTYTIPPTNPFINTPGYRGEIWALGLRNPWRFSFDRQNGDLYLGDNGQDSYEEVDYQPGNSMGGANYGWRIMEGNHCYNPPTGCNTSGLTLPIYEYARTGGCASVISGFVYRGMVYPRMRGIYFFGDYCNGYIFGLRRVNRGWEHSVLLNIEDLFNLVSFGEDEQGELYVAHLGNGKIYKIVDSLQTCTYSISPLNQTFTSSGGTGSINITTSSGCAWTATSNAPWITVTSGGSGSGSGTVSFTVQPNTGLERKGTISAGSQTFTVNQANGCSYSLSVATANYAATGGSGSVNVTSGTGCPWTAVSNASWITVTGGGIGTGNGTVSYTVSSNTGPARTGTVTVGGQTFTLNQANGCVYTLSANSINLPAEGGISSVNITAGSGCPWTAQSNVSWITLTSGTSGGGNGIVTLNVAPNTGISRTGTVNIADQTFTVTQATGCSFSLSPSSTNFTANGGVGSFNVASGTGCAWTASTNDSWIAINSGSNGTGNGAVTFTVQLNLGPSRTGAIVVNGQNFTINQESGCTFTLSSATANITAFGGTGSFQVNSNAGCVWTASSNVTWVNITSGGNGTGTGIVAFSVQRNNTVAPRTGLINVQGQIFTVNQSAPVAGYRNNFDFDGDSKADVSVFRLSDGVWYLNQSAAGFTGVQFGISTDKITPADYDGDGKTDIAVYRNGVWYLLRSTAGFTGIQFGLPEDIPQPADFDGDGRSEIAVYRPSEGIWYILNLANNQFSGVQFGISTDKPVVADYDGDGKANFAVYRPSEGVWYIARATGNPSQNFDAVRFGNPGDQPVPADYDGDGKTDQAVYRPSDGMWYLLRSRDGFGAAQFGIPTDIPGPADFDGDGKADLAVYRNGVWFLSQSTAGFAAAQFGTSGDKPVTAAFVQ